MRETSAHGGDEESIREREEFVSHGISPHLNFAKIGYGPRNQN